MQTNIYANFVLILSLSYFKDFFLKNILFILWLLEFFVSSLAIKARLQNITGIRQIKMSQDCN